MTLPRLKSLEVAGFRSINSQVELRLDAPVVLVHGYNGAGKTSLLSALELALTGSVPSLERVDRRYRRQLVNYDVGRGSIRLQVDGLDGLFADTKIELTRETTRTPGGLNPELSQYNGERCYLPQTTLSQLLSIYAGDDGSMDTPLSKFAAELLGLDRLDALQRGLQPARDARNVRPLVPTYRTLEERQASLAGDVKVLDAELQAIRSESVDIGLQISEVMTGLEGQTSDSASEDALRDALAKLDNFERKAAELSRSAERIRRAWAGGQRDVLAERARQIDLEVARWQDQNATRIERLFASAAAHLSDVPSGITASVAGDVPRMADELDRLASVTATVVAKAATALTRMTLIDDEILTANTKVADLDRSIASLGRSAPDLAAALSTVLPHIHGEHCPVCGRDYSEVSQRSLADAVRDRLDAITAAASRLADDTSQRSALTGVISNLQRERAMLAASQATVEERLRLQAASASLGGLVAEARELTDAPFAGAALLGRQADAVRGLEGWSRADVEEEILRTDIDALEVDMALASDRLELAPVRLARMSDAINARREEMTRQLSDVSRLTRLHERLTALNLRQVEAEQRRDQRVSAKKRADDAFRAAGEVRRSVGRLAEAASVARSRVVAEVFNDRLNSLWRDLFVRLAPDEEFVPSFDVPPGPSGRVRPVLKTIHRSGKDGGPPSVMLSSGNLNTAALTLFLALHLSVQPKLPWLILDDPVQSMDDVHIAHFAALLRTLSKEHGRQILVAVHDRALFEYLALEMSPAFPTDELITIELERSSAGKTRCETERLAYVRRPRLLPTAA